MDFVIFATMKDALKHTYLLFLALSLTLILADCNFMGNAFSTITLSSQRECPDLPDDSHHSNTVCFEDEIFISDSKIKSIEFPGHFELVPAQESNFKSRYITSIWQPPRFS